MKFNDEGSHIIATKGELKALLAYCSSDEYRTQLNQVLFGEEAVVSTDGHRMLVWSPPSGQPDKGRRAVVERSTLAGLLKVLSKGQTAAIPVDGGEIIIFDDNANKFAVHGKSIWHADADRYPEWQVIVKGVGENPSAEPFGLNPRYLADCALLWEFADFRPGKSDTGLRMVASGQFQPIIAELLTKVGAVNGHPFVILMPMRLKD